MNSPPAHNAPAITITQLHFAYGKSEPVLTIPRWQVERGQQVFLKGASGSGKSTLLHLLAGILVAQTQQVQMLGQDLAALSSRQRDRFRARHIGMVFQQFNLIPYLNVHDNIQLARHLAGLPTHDLAQQAATLFDALKLNNALLNQRADQLSVGQQQRVAIARALINQPEILLADEPTSALDSDLRDRFIELLLEVCQREGSTLIFVSHDSHLAQHFSQVVALESLNQTRYPRHVF